MKDKALFIETRVQTLNFKTHNFQTLGIMTCLDYYIGIEEPLNIIFFLINIICAVISTFSNGVVVYVVFTVQRLQRPSHWLLVALAFTDLLAGGLSQPMYGIYLGFFHTTNNCYIEKSIVFISAASCTTSLLLLCLIAHDRYLHISKGLRYKQFTSQLRILWQVIISWFISLIVAGTFLLSGSGYKQYLGFACFFSIPIFSFIYISVTYLRIKRILQIHFEQMRSESYTQDECSDAPPLSARLLKHKAYNTTVLMIISLFAIVWLPFMAIMISGTVYHFKKEIPGTWLQNGFVWTAILTYINGAVNPFIYGVRYKELGQEIKMTLFKVLRRSQHASGQCSVRDQMVIN